MSFPGVKKVYNKYGNIRVTIDGIKFDSKKEARYWLVFKEMETRGEISNLERQVKYTFPCPTGLVRHTKSNRPVTYVADFVYEKNGMKVVADAKGIRTQDYKLKAAMMLHLNGIRVIEL